MKILVTGATGFIGSWVVRELAAAGHLARVLVRKSSNLANLSALLAGSGGAQVERAEGDVLDAASVDKALLGCDGVIHTAGVSRFNPDDVPMMQRVNTEGTEIVLSAALRAQVKRAVLTSSVGAMGGSKTARVADESTPSNAEELGIHYNVSKWRGEQAALRLCQKGLPLLVIRPAVALGPGDIYHSSTATFLALAQHQLPVYVAGGASFGDVRDMARAHVAALTRGRLGEVYIVGGHNLEIAALVAQVAELTGVPAPRAVPYPLALAVAAVAELSGKALRRKLELSRQLVMASHLYTWVSSARAIAELGYTIRPLQESLHDTFRYFLKNGRLKPTTPELQALAGSESGEFRPSPAASG
ncbi:MAG TPA: NAD-dependent epimerase/dehydratase family protein [Pseudomonadota bacterium]|nr:NAD-dependent epimerase/dehydratase family protein [Pseudomonadota bacterium]